MPRNSKRTEYTTRLKDLIALRDRIRSFSDDFENKWTQFLLALAEKGIKSAREHSGRYKGNISYTKVLNDGTSVSIIGTDKSQIRRKWITNGKLKYADISPLYMAEFGSGWNANIMDEYATGVGQGTFPNQTNAFNPDGWSWKDTSGVVHWSDGEVPDYPMYNATLEMIQSIDEVAKKVFK